MLIKNHFKFIFSNLSNDNNIPGDDGKRKSIWLAGRFALNEMEAASFIINDARHFLKVIIYIICYCFIFRYLFKKFFCNTNSIILFLFYRENLALNLQVGLKVTSIKLIWIQLWIQ